MKNYVKKWLVCTITASLLVIPDILAKEPALEITVPSNRQSRIAPNRDFYVLGNIEGSVEPNDQLEVTLYKDFSLTPVRKISVQKNSSQQRIDYSELSYYGKNRQELSNAMMPDLAVPQGKLDLFSEPRLKAVLSDDAFTAVVHGGIYTQDIKQESPLSEGNYWLNVSLKSKNGDIKSQQQKQLKIQHAKKRMLSRFSPASHFENISQFAEVEHSEMFLDPFPGYWSPASYVKKFDGSQLFAEILPKWRLADLLEYQENLAQFIVYNVSETSATYNVEIGTLEEQQAINDETRLKSYYYNQGDLVVNGIKSEIVPFNKEDRLQLTRVDTEVTKDEIVDTQEIAGNFQTDIQLSDGVEVQAGTTIAINGVVTPIQNQPSDIKRYTDNHFEMKNKIKTIVYQVVDENGKLLSQQEKLVGLVRNIDGRFRPSVFEFHHNLSIPSEWKEKTVTVTVDAYDSYHQKVEGSHETIQLQVQ